MKPLAISLAMLLTGCGAIGAGTHLSEDRLMVRTKSGEGQCELRIDYTGDTAAKKAIAKEKPAGETEDDEDGEDGEAER